MIVGLRVAVECDECGADHVHVFMDECGRWLCEVCQFFHPCEAEELAA